MFNHQKWGSDSPSLIQHGQNGEPVTPGDAGTAQTPCARTQAACEAGERHQVYGCAQWPRSLGEGGALIFFSDGDELSEGC